MNQAEAEAQYLREQVERGLRDVSEGRTISHQELKDRQAHRRATRMTTDAEILSAVRGAFADRPRPEHFTNYRHCCECAEHDELLRSRDPETLALEDVGNAGWDPICFITPDGFRYYLPALARLALTTPAEENGPWYGDQILFHLTSCGKHNQHLPHCSPEQRSAVVRFLWHLLETRPALVKDYTLERELERAIELWDAGACV